MNPTLSTLTIAAAAIASFAASTPAFATTTLPFNATIYLGGGGAAPGGRCAPAFTLSQVNQTQTHSNLGSFVFNGTECINPPPPTSTFDGEFTFEFANGTMGGTSFSKISSTALPAIFNLDGEFKVTHGTGAFAGANGLLVSRGQLDRRAFPPTATGMLTLVGTVAVVPEPATYGLMLAGLGVVGVASRRGSHGARGGAAAA